VSRATKRTLKSLGLTRAGVVTALWAVSIVVCDGQATHVRSIEYSGTPIADQLVPSDEVVVVRRKFDVIEPQHFDTAEEIVDQTTRWAAGIAVVRFQSSQSVLVNGGTWIRTRMQTNIREVVKSTSRLTLRKGQNVEVSINGGQLKIGRALVRSESVPRVAAGREYLIFIHAGAGELGLEMIRMPLQVDHGKLASTAKTRGYDSVVDPLDGQDMASVIQRIKSLGDQR
jgi:hypothetical protein